MDFGNRLGPARGPCRGQQHPASRGAQRRRNNPSGRQSATHRSVHRHGRIRRRESGVHRDSIPSRQSGSGVRRTAERLRHPGLRSLGVASLRSRLHLPARKHSTRRTTLGAGRRSGGVPQHLRSESRHVAGCLPRDVVPNRRDAASDPSRAYAGGRPDNHCGHFPDPGSVAQPACRCRPATDRPLPKRGRTDRQLELHGSAGSKLRRMETGAGDRHGGRRR